MADILDDEASENALARMLSATRLLSELRTYYLLLVALVATALFSVCVFVALDSPLYTATAVVGPADNSDQPFSDGLAGALGGSLGGIAKHLHVGGMLGQQGLNDTFDEYTSLLTSNRLAEILVRKDHILPEIFSDDWDSVHQRWLPRIDPVHRAVDWLKIVLHRPLKPVPDLDDLEKYFEKNLIVDPSLETSFATVSLRFRAPDGAERLLGLILREADNAIREDKRRDVAARIAYLNTALEHLSLADQKPQLIDIISDQEQEMMMVESDHLYASILIDTPYAPLKPSSPSPVVDGAIALALAMFGWLCMVRAAPEARPWARVLAAFARPGLRTSPPRRAKALNDPLADAIRFPPTIKPGGETSIPSAR